MLHANSLYFTETVYKFTVFAGTRKHLKHNKLRAFTLHIAVNLF
jgi:hypothetical protein